MSHPYLPALATAAAIAAIAALAPAASAQAATAAAANAVHVGKAAGHSALVDARGMTLYTFDEDKGGTPTCTWFCAIAWPPAKAAGAAAPTSAFTVVKRSGGASQWAYRGRPLYTYVKDHAPGETHGDGADGTWHVARP